MRKRINWRCIDITNPETGKRISKNVVGNGKLGILALGAAVIGAVIAKIGYNIGAEDYSRKEVEVLADLGLFANTGDSSSDSSAEN